MERSFLEPRNQQPCGFLRWTQPSSAVPCEATVAPSHSASSAVVTPTSHEDGRGAPAESSEHSSPSPKERDYIGTAEVTSAPSSVTGTDIYSTELNLSETDLRLGLGPATQATISGINKVSEVQKSASIDQISSRASSIAKSHKLVDTSNGALHIHEEAAVLNQKPSSWQNISMKSSADAAMPVSHITALVSASKNGGKRMYADAMVDVFRDHPRVILNMSSSPATAEPRSCAGPMVPNKQFQDQDRMSSQGSFWVPSHVPTWRPQAAHASQNGMVSLSAAGDNDKVVQSAVLDAPHGKNKGSRVQPMPNEEKVPADEGPPAKGQVVGWPPVRSYRRSTLSVQSKPSGDDGDSQPAIYVKVNMDGIPIGRKVDLNAYKSYDTFLSALEDLFHNPISGLDARFLRGSEFVLTYEDKEGDWMLVGDVPWRMFVNTVRRLRITPGSHMLSRK